ncbi:hypothetical protein BGZ72_010184 [Mortierella alpina]|nr:hypothetical protein BGZ72_010184 [Mortierella alpina]
MDFEPPNDTDDLQSCTTVGSVHRGVQIGWLLSAPASLPVYSEYFRLAGRRFCFVLDRIVSSGHYSFGLKLCRTLELMTPLEVRADIVVSTADRTRRLGNQSFKGNYDRESRVFGVPNILLAKTMAQERSFLFEATLYAPEDTPSRLEILWQNPSASDVVILSSDGSEPVLVNQDIVLQALPNILDIVTINEPADESDRHHSSQASSSTDVNNIQQAKRAGTSSPKDDYLVDLSESTAVSFVSVGTPSEPNQDEDEELLIGEPIQEYHLQPFGNRKTRRKKQKHTKSNHHGPRVGSSVPEEGSVAPLMTDGCSTSEPSPSSSSNSSEILLLSERFPDASSSEPNTPKPKPAVLPSLRQRTAEDRKVWIWPKDLPTASCERLMRWVYSGALPWSPLEEFNEMYTLLSRLGDMGLLQSYVAAQRRAIERHADPWSLIASTDYNAQPAKTLLRPVLLATIDKRWSSISTSTALARMLWSVDPSGVLLEIIQTRAAPQG